MSVAADVVVVGAGVVGAACALAAARAGLAVTVVDRGPVAGGTTGAGEGNLLVVTGTPIALQGGLDALLARAADLDARTAAPLLCMLDGAFAILHWDQRQRTLTIVTDCLGAQPLHLARRRGAFFCSTGLRGLTGSQVVPSTPDAAAWGSFFVFIFSTKPKEERI